jgi:hypothetical protein
MPRLMLADVLNFFEYEKVRELRRREIIDLKRVRRVQVGRYLSFDHPGERARTPLPEATRRALLGDLRG